MISKLVFLKTLETLLFPSSALQSHITIYTEHLRVVQETEI
uniref:Uncharacterized protein n=1 Tax=Anguilla anguilla TaxID=7936 RepID=A0A0E9V9H7_ANGAN